MDIEIDKKTQDNEWTYFSITIKYNQKNKYEPIEKKEELSKKYFSLNNEINMIIDLNNINHEIVARYLSTYKKKDKLFTESLTSTEYLKIFKKNRAKNPLNLLIKSLNNIIQNKKQSIEILNIKPILYKLPLIYGIERTRINYYLWYIINKIYKDTYDLTNFSMELKLFKAFINYLNKLNHDEICDKEDFNIKLYLFIFEICEVYFEDSCSKEKNFIPNIFNKLIPQFLEYNNEKDDKILYRYASSYVKKLKNKQFEISNGFENKIIDENDYNIEMMIEDLSNNPNYPLEILLLKNESINHYISKNEVFISRLGLMEGFKDYFFQFINSKCFMDVFSDKMYNNVREFIISDNAKKILFNERYLKFVPLPITGYLGFTNKDILISIVSGYPLLVKNLRLKNYRKVDEKILEYIKNFCYLMAIGEKFLTITHEQALHFIYGYLNYLSPNNKLDISSKRKISSENNKKDNNEEFGRKDRGNFLEKQLFGSVVFNLNIINVLTLLDGECIKNSKTKFKKIFNEEINLKNINQRINKCSGFLKKFLELYQIDFNSIFNLFNLDLIFISAKGNSGIYIELPKNKSSFIHYDLMNSNIDKNIEQTSKIDNNDTEINEEEEEIENEN